jgi:hypothetical protein
MHYITKPAMLQSQKPGPPPPNNKVKYPQDVSVWTVKISLVHKVVLRGLCQNLQPYKVLVNK